MGTCDVLKEEQGNASLTTQLDEMSSLQHTIISIMHINLLSLIHRSRFIKFIFENVRVQHDQDIFDSKI